MEISAALYFFTNRKARDSNWQGKISHREVLKDAVSIPSYRRAVMSCEPGARAHLCPGSQDATTGRSQCPRSLRTDGYTIARQLLME
jgi:hypothetical protein